MKWNILIYLVWLYTIFCGAMVDSRMWGDKEKDPPFLKKWTDFFWLISFFSIIPMAFSYLCKIFPWNFTDYCFYNGIVAVGLSPLWDLLYSKIDKGSWIAPLRYWFEIRGIIRIDFSTNAEIMKFHIARGLILIVSIALII